MIQQKILVGITFLVDNDKVVNAWCMPGGKIAVYTGLLKITKNTNAFQLLWVMKLLTQLLDTQLKE